MQRDPAAPPELDGYTAVRVLGLGGFSDVFLYQQELPRRQVAVKVLTGVLTDAVRTAFVREANLMAALSTHPYIVTIHQAGIARDGRPYLVMEYCSRPSLAERYKRQPLSIADTLRTGIRIAGAVATLHGAGILHRDIKPANVLTNDYGWPALTDFGIATAFGPGGAGAGTVGPAGAGSVAGGGFDATGGTGTIGLSVPWSPPEMFVDVPDPDVRSDVFSLAATLYTVLAGRTPFEIRGGPNGQLDLISRIERGEVTPMSRTDVPVSLLAALARGMAPRREDRWPSALELARALQRVELELGYAPTGIELPGAEAPSRRSDPDDDGGDGDENATRVRAMPTVIAQPAAPPAPSTPPAPPPTAVAPAAPAPSGVADLPRRRARIVGIVVGILAVLAVGAVVVAVLIAGLPHETAAGPGSSPTGGSAIGPGLPQPTKGAAAVSPDGTEVTFTWTNPSPEKGDVYYWARSESPDDRQVTPHTRVVVTGVVPGSRVCIDVALGRSGRTSAPERICTRP
ncbi:serine/threonine-protein kinase [Pseudolysinimonas kribbensis]|uniref:serine/threonine-protein kinase n=2 Tax=Pseudolysinimonas kribbensis TaxID=433641 RepID=UPI0031D9A87F